MTIDDKKERLENKPMFDSTIFDPALFDTGLYHANGIIMPDRLEVSPEFLTGVYTTDPFIETPHKTDIELSSIHEPISEHEKKIQELALAVFELQFNDEQNDILIQELQDQLWVKKRELKSRKKSKSQETKLRKEVEELKEIVKTHQNEWRFTKDMHKEESKDTSQE